jgi:hypothetical protein
MCKGLYKRNSKIRMIHRSAYDTSVNNDQGGTSTIMVNRFIRETGDKKRKRKSARDGTKDRGGGD